MGSAYVGSQTLVPVLGLVGDLDKLYYVPISVTVRSRLMFWETTLDVRLGSLDIPSRRGGPYLTSVQLIYTIRRVTTDLVWWRFLALLRTT